MWNLIHTFEHDLLRYGWQILWVSGVCLLLELAWPASNYSLKSRLRGGLFWAIYITLTVLFFTGFNAWWSTLGIKPLFTLHLKSFAESPYAAVRVASWIIAPLIAASVSEFFYYWFHRSQHTWAILWRFHAVHHSIEEMSAFNSNHHFSEEILRIPFITLPMSFLIGIDAAPTVLVMAILIQMQGQYEHSCTKFNFGIFRYLVADNRFHRIHHSIEMEQWGNNFGSFLPIWDIVFRTAIFPQKGEWPAVGIPGTSEPKTIGDFLWMPFRSQVQSLDGAAKDQLPSAAVADHP